LRRNRSATRFDTGGGTRVISRVVAGSLDITREVCPMTYVRTKLKLESLARGEVLEVFLAGDEPLRNIPLQARQEGHEVLSLEMEANGIWRLLLRKS
jgi:TusA-related sulfurtransferase